MIQSDVHLYIDAALINVLIQIMSKVTICNVIGVARPENNHSTLPFSSAEHFSIFELFVEVLWATLKDRWYAAQHQMADSQLEMSW